MIKFSFIIPVKAINDYIHEAVPNILKIKRDDYEIIIYPDEVTDNVWPKTKQIETGHCGPAEKRSLAIRDAQGEILVFIDDDSYPEVDFLEKLEKDFLDPSITAIGGPAITPSHDSFWQKVSGAVFLSSFSGGAPERYVSVGKKRFVDDWPSVNLSVRKYSFGMLGGFDCDYWPGEDTKLCLDIVKKLKGKILYDPELIVFHHRREGFLRHLKQAGGYGLHRGFFAKTYPETSFRFKYFVPSVFLLFVVFGGALAFFVPWIFKLYIFGMIVYGLALCKALWDITRYEKNTLVCIHALYYIFFTHLLYGLYFLKGFVYIKHLKSKLR